MSATNNNYRRVPQRESPGGLTSSTEESNSPIIRSLSERLQDKIIAGK